MEETFWILFRVHGTLNRLVTQKIYVNVRWNICYSICLRHLIRSRAETNRFFFHIKNQFPLGMRNVIRVIPSNISTMVTCALSLSNTQHTPLMSKIQFAIPNLGQGCGSRYLDATLRYFIPFFDVIFSFYPSFFQFFSLHFILKFLFRG